MQPTSKIWRVFQQDVTVEVSLHAEGAEYTPAGRGIYCVYVYIYESKCSTEKFAELWLEDKLTRIADNCPERVTHDYYSLPILKHVEFSGGCTFYQKNGHSVGHRSVKLGCDYNHIWDIESPPTLESVIRDAMQLAEQTLDYLNK